VTGVGITGAHVVLFSSEPEALRATLRDVFGWRSVDAGDGWLIFALPPAELGVHAADAPSHELFLMCDDISATVEQLREKGVEVVGEPEPAGFGVVVTVVLPGSLRLKIYQPRHNTAI